MYRTFESIKNWQRYKCLKIFVIPGGNTPPTKFSRGDASATLPNRNGRYQGTTCTSWLNFYTPCKSQPISLPYYWAYSILFCCYLSGYNGPCTLYNICWYFGRISVVSVLRHFLFYSAVVVHGFRWSRTLPSKHA